MMESMRSVTKRIGRVDIAVAALFVIAAVASMASEIQKTDPKTSVLAVPAFALVVLPVAWRRVAPVGAAAATLLALLAHVALFGGVVRCGIVFPLLLVLAFPAGSRLELRDAALALALNWASALTICLTDPKDGAPLAAFPFVAVLAAGVWGVGRLVRSRSEMADQLSARTVELRDARDERARLEVATDRARLSAELDEVLQRRLSELARLAGDGADPNDVPATTARLAEIEQQSRRTLEEMRQLVGVMRDDDAGNANSPQPTLTHLEAMLARAKGADARLIVEGNPRVLPAGVELSAYRVVEHLLAALDDAPGVEVKVHFGDEALEIGVSGRPRKRASAEIERARERVRLHRGTLVATTRRGRAEAVASLPTLVGA